ncbi:hypothetical protein [Caudoviricetes sp.]|nr:hypothetical protein [Caudoviricetes sp.]
MPWRKAFDKGGKYTLIAQEYERGESAYGGGYQNSPLGAPSETKVGSEVTLALYIGQRLTTTLGGTTDSAATLTLWVWNDTIQATSRTLHGEVTPSLVPSIPSAKSLAAVEAEGVQVLLAALAGQTTANAIGSPEGILADFIGAWNAHIVDGTYHSTTDTWNTLTGGLAGDPSTSSLKEAVTEILARMRFHYLNDAVLSATGANGRDSVSIHNVGGSKNDNANLPLLTGVGDADAYWALAELHRSYEAHRVTDIHTDPDTANTLAALPPLLQLASAFFGAIAATSPAAPPAQSTGAHELIGRAAFSETPL